MTTIAVTLDSQQISAAKAAVGANHLSELLTMREANIRSFNINDGAGSSSQSRNT